jgi:hypothetical protein
MKWAEEHPSEFELWLLVEGELQPKRAAALTRHVEYCWKCKADLEMFRGMIVAFMEYRQRCAGPIIQSRPSSKARFQQRLRLLEESLHTSKRGRPLSRHLFYPGLVPRVLATVTTVAFLVFAFQLVLAPVASANEIIRKSIEAEKIPVTVHQRIRMQSGLETVTRDFWRDRGARPVAASTASSGRGLTDIERRLIDVGWSVTDPLSVQTFARWRNSLRVKNDAVGAHDGCLRLRTSTGEGGIAAAELTVRKSDFHLLSETLKIRDLPAIELEEIDFDKDVELPAPRQPVAPKLLRSPGLARKTKEPPPPAAAPPNQEELEATARVVLHQLNDDWGEPVEVLRDRHDQVFLQALDVDPSQLDQIHRALPGVAIVTTPAVSLGLDQAPSPARRSSAGTSLTKIPILDQQLPDAEKRSEFGDAVLQTSRLALLRAYALRNLTSRYPDTQWVKVSPELRLELNSVFHDHLSALRQLARQLNDQLTPIIGGEPAPPAFQRQSTESILTQTQDVDLGINILFAGAYTNLSADDAVSRLRHSLSVAISALNDVPETIHP